MAPHNPTWTVASADDAEQNAFFAGFEADGKKVYVGRATDASGNFTPAKIVPELKKAFFERDGSEQTSEKIDYLSGDYDWVKSSNGETVPDAVTINGFYVGRGVWNKNVVVGRVDLNTKKLVATYAGDALNLSEYDVLIFKPQDNTRIVNSSGFISSEKQTIVNTVNSVITVEKVPEDRMVIREPLFNQTRYFEMLNKIQTLELELASYKHEREAFENRVEFEQQRVEDLSKKLQELRLQNSTLTKERIIYEERISTESTMTKEIESKLQGVFIDNAFLLKKVNSLEESLKYERYQIALFNEKYQRDQSLGSSMQIKIKNYEETIRNMQQRIAELEGIIDNTNSGSDSLTQQVKNYEVTIQNMKIQLEGLLKKLQSSNADNEFLVKKLGLLTQSLKNYQIQLEAMNRKLNNSKIIIASANADLGRANAQISKYQAALSQCYILNGELMTKVSGLHAVTQFQGTFDSKFDILNLNRELSLGTTSSKSITFNTTSSLLEATGSESYVGFIKASQENGIDSSESGSQPATPF